MKNITYSFEVACLTELLIDQQRGYLLNLQENTSVALKQYSRPIMIKHETTELSREDN